MFDYFKPRDFFIDYISFNYDEIHYQGNGFLNWHPDEGFRIVSHVKHERKNLPFHKERKWIDFPESTRLYMVLENGMHAVAPRAFLDKIEPLYGRLVVHTNRIIFIQKTNIPIQASWSGSALLEIHKNIQLPDVVAIEKRIGDGEPERSFSRAGIHYEDEAGIRIYGYRNENKCLELDWYLPFEQWTKSDCWNFAIGLRDSISILAGEEIQLKYREVHRANRIFREVLFTDKPTSLGLIFRPFPYNILDKDLIVELAKFFIREDQRADVCRNILKQMAEASRQRTKQGQELLLSTILEATLRTIYGVPFGKKISRTYYLKKFGEEYLVPSSGETNSSWKKVTTKVDETYKRLRDRNAHPDWLTTSGGAYSKTEMQKALNDMIFLSRFYGYIIMGLANIKQFKPEFPKPFENWKPMITYDGFY